MLASALHPSASWDERFPGLEHTSPDAATLLKFLCSLHPDEIPEILFCRMWTTRECWSCDGETEHVKVSLDAPLIGLLTCQTQFHEGIQLLESLGFIKSEPGPLGKRKFSIKPDLRDYVTAITGNLSEVEWVRLVLVCHSFPGRLEEIGFGDTGRALLPQLRHAFTHCKDLKDRILTHPSAGHGILLALLLSSKLHGRDWKLRAVALAEEMLPDHPPFDRETLYLRMFVRQRRRDLSRRIPNSSVDNAYKELFPIDPRTNALYGEYLRLNAQDRIMEGFGDLDGALKELRKFEYFDAVRTTIEEQEKDHHLFIEGKIHRWRASFFEASEIFYRMLAARPSLSNEMGSNLTGHYIATLCEQRRLAFAEKTARQAVACCEDCDKQGLKRQGLKMFRSLQLSLAETLICHTLVETVDGRRDTEKIDQWLVESECMYEGMKGECELIKRRGEGTWGSELDYLRVCIGRALVSHLANRLTEAHNRWQDARKSAEVCQNKVTGFIPMIMDYCDCDINMKLGRYKDADKLLKRARSCFNEVGREYWWTGLGTFLLDWLKASIPESGIDTGTEIVPN
ncbi:MAG: hypothetical protein LQ352_000121 [Teloschistes flavicans]|nr:MAG: hypothetical protein LQ352_000121 [Teloschistes flavicans]